MRQVSNQPGRFFPTAKTHKFPSLNDIIIESLKLCPLLNLKEVLNWNSSKIKANYL